MGFITINGELVHTSLLPDPYEGKQPDLQTFYLMPKETTSAPKKRRRKKVELVKYLPDGELPRKKQHAAQDKA